MSSQRSSWLPWIILLILAGGGFAAFRYFRKPADKTITFRSGTVSKGDIVQSVSANGQISPVVNVAVGSQVSGNILKIYVDFNSKVTNGQLIAELEPATYLSRVTQAEGDLANAQAQMELSKVNLERAEQLKKDKLIAPSEYDQLKAELAQRAASVRVREAALTNAAVDLARTRIYSPIDGTVISRNIDVGQTVQASFTAPTLFNIVNDLAKMEIAAMVSEADIGGVEEGQPATFTVEAFPARTFLGRVKQVRNQPTTNQNVVTYSAMIDVRNDDLKLKPGMTATVSITTARKDGALRVANAATRFKPPEGAVVRSNVVLLASAKSTNASPDTAAAPVDDGIPEFPGGFQPTPEMRKRILDRYDKNGDGRLDEEERKAFLEARARRQAEGGGGFGGGRGMGGGDGGGGMGGGMGGGPGPGMGQRQRSAPASPLRTVYLLSTNVVENRKIIELQPVQVRVGIADASFTEIQEGLKEGDVVATGAITPISTTTPTASPFGGSPFGGPRRP